MLLLVTYGWSPTKFEERIELHIHPIILLCAIIYIIPPLIYEGYNPECGHCVPVPLPMNCGYWIFGSNSSADEVVVECIRGSATLAYVYWIIFFTLLPLVTIFCSTAMYIVYHTVRAQEERRSSIRSFHEDHHRESKRIRKTMVLYTSSFYLCWIVPTIFLWVPHTVATLKIIGDILMPLQGVSGYTSIAPYRHFFLIACLKLLFSNRKFLCSIDIHDSSLRCLYSSNQNVSNINIPIQARHY